MTTCRRKVLVYGDTLFLQGIAVTLRARMDLDITEARLAPPADLNPDVLLVDAAQTSLAETETLLKTFAPPHTLNIVRLDADRQSLTVHSIHSRPAVCLADLTQAIEQIFNNSNGEFHAA